MKASETRLNNLIFKNGIITEITPDIMLELLRYSTPFEPMPLTEEILLRFGFIKESKFSYSFKNFLVEFMFQDITLSFRIKISEKESVFLTDLHYVHELQNLYFALTKEELTLN